MTKFAAIKIHYDHRKSLAPYLKYSKPPTYEEYREHVNSFNNENRGGAGFHECMNFSVSNNSPTKIYLPPTCIPNKKYFDEEMVFFSFTYKSDEELPSRIIGVHAGARVISSRGGFLARNDIQTLKETEPFHYHAEAPCELTTLITPTLKYDFEEGIYTPKYSAWGNGLRYITEEHATNIINEALSGAKERLAISSTSEAIILAREITVLESIQRRYSLSSSELNLKPHEAGSSNSSQNNTLPDKEIGFLGEKFVYENEIDYANTNGIPESEVEWISQSDPQSPYDIKTVRLTPHGKKQHFIEVKSSRKIDDSNIYISSRQVKFFQENESSSTLKVVTFISNTQVDTVRDYTLKQLMNTFELIPIKFKLQNKK